MKKIVVITGILALSFATGFTCSKNAPEQTAAPVETSAPPADQAQMAAPAEGGQAAASADGSAAQPATPAPTETH